MSKENYFFRKNSFGVYLSPERKEILEQNYETVFGTDGDLKPAEAFWILFETALNQNTAKCNIKELEEHRIKVTELQTEIGTLKAETQIANNTVVALRAQIETDKETVESWMSERAKLVAKIEELLNLTPVVNEVTKEVPALVGENQILITFTSEQKAMLDETRILLAERNINWSNDEILARLFVDFTIKGPCDFYPRVLKGARIKEIIEQFKSKETTQPQE